MDKKNTNLDELLKIIAASGAGIPIAGIRVMVKKVDEEEPVSYEAVDKEPLGHKPVSKMDTPTAECMDEPAEPTKKQPISICIENLHIHMDERMTTNYGPARWRVCLMRTVRPMRKPVTVVMVSPVTIAPASPVIRVMTMMTASTSTRWCASSAAVPGCARGLSWHSLQHRSSIWTA